MGRPLTRTRCALPLDRKLGGATGGGPRPCGTAGYPPPPPPPPPL